MKYAVDRFEEDIVILENMVNGEIIEAEKNELPEGVHEGSILVYNTDHFELDIDTEKERRESLRERMERLKKLRDEN